MTAAGPISVPVDGVTFVFRAAAVAMRGEDVLLHRAETDDFWAFPGGRIRPGELAAGAVEREMREEIDADVAVGRLLWVVENLFSHAFPDRDGTLPAEPTRYHELGMYYLIGVPGRLRDVDNFWGSEPDAGGLALEFRWFTPVELETADVRPAVVSSALRDGLPDGPQHLVQTD